MFQWQLQLLIVRSVNRVAFGYPLLDLLGEGLRLVGWPIATAISDRIDDATVVTQLQQDGHSVDQPADEGARYGALVLLEGIDRCRKSID